MGLVGRRGHRAAWFQRVRYECHPSAIELIQGCSPPPTAGVRGIGIRLGTTQILGEHKDYTATEATRTRLGTRRYRVDPSTGALAPHDAELVIPSGRLPIGNFVSFSVCLSAAVARCSVKGGGSRWQRALEAHWQAPAGRRSFDHLILGCVDLYWHQNLPGGLRGSG